MEQLPTDTKQIGRVENVFHVLKHLRGIGNV